MNVYHLPKDINSTGTSVESDIVVHHYLAGRDSFREKSILEKNAFSLVIRGSKTMHFSEKTVAVKDTAIHLLSAGNCIASVEISGGQPFESILIFFSSHLLADFINIQRPVSKDQPKGVELEKSFLEFPKDAFIENYIESLLLLCKNPRTISEAMKHAKLNELFIYLLENYRESFLSFQRVPVIRDTELVIRKVMEANVNNNLTLDELAFLCNISTATFKRHFRKIYNEPPVKWLNRQKMLLAGRMLKSRDIKPGEIWHQLGFETHTGFTKSFKKHYGKLPKDFANTLSLQE